MNNKGFTLIELLGVVLLLGILLATSVPAIQSIIDGSKKKSFDLIIDNVKTALETYNSEYGCTHEDVICEWNLDNTCNCITLDDLITKGSLQANTINESGVTVKKIINPVTNKEVTFDLTITRNDIPDEPGIYKYTYSAVAIDRPE